MKSEALEKIWTLDKGLSSLNDLEDCASIDRFTGHCRFCYESCFFITKDGYISLAPLDIEVDDVISVILGCDVPVVLRKAHSFAAESEATRWRIVGTCYAHGMMSGEAIYENLPNHYRAV